MASPSVRIRRHGERGVAEYGWLSSRHSFTFGSHHDPEHSGFRALRVINDDRVKPGRGFATHPHRDMEILSFVVEGELEHRHSQGNGSVVRPCEVQRMTAGTGILHSEFNPSRDRELRFLQVWIEPERAGLEPGYEQRTFPLHARSTDLVLVASRDGRDGATTIHQDASVYRSLITAGRWLEYAADPNRYVWLQVVRGQVRVTGRDLVEGDGLAVNAVSKIDIMGVTDEADVIMFDLA